MVGDSGSIEFNASDPDYSFVPKTCTDCLASALRSAPEQIPDEVLEMFEEDCTEFVADSSRSGYILTWDTGEDEIMTVMRESYKTWLRNGEEVSVEYHGRRTARLVCEKTVQLALWVDEC